MVKNFTDKWDIKSMMAEEITEEMKAIAQPAFRARQIYGWLHQHHHDLFSLLGMGPENDGRKQEIVCYRARMRLGD